MQDRERQSLPTHSPGFNCIMDALGDRRPFGVLFSGIMRARRGGVSSCA